MTTKRQRDENLMVVVAAEQYAHKYNMPTSRVMALFHQHGINLLIRKHYNTLHTQPLDESFYFAEDVLKRKLNGQCGSCTETNSTTRFQFTPKKH